MFPHNFFQIFLKRFQNSKKSKRHPGADEPGSQSGFPIYSLVPSVCGTPPVRSVGPVCQFVGLTCQVGGGTRMLVCGSYLSHLSLLSVVGPTCQFSAASVSCVVGHACQFGVVHVSCHSWAPHVSLVVDLNCHLIGGVVEFYRQQLNVWVPPVSSRF